MPSSSQFLLISFRDYWALGFERLPCAKTCVPLPTTRCCAVSARYDAVIHFAGLKAVGESVAHPELYYDNNLVGTINLYKTMKKHGCMKVRATRFRQSASRLPASHYAAAAAAATVSDPSRARADGVLVVGDRVRLARGDPVRRGRQAAGREPLRQDQGKKSPR